MSVRWDTKRKQFIVDYYNYYENDEGKWIHERKRIGLPRTVTDIAMARSIEHDLKKPDQNSEFNPYETSTVNEMFPLYLEYCKLHKEKTTTDNIRWTYEKQFKEHLGNFRLGEIDKGHTTVYKRLRLETGVKNRTVNKEMAYFMGFLKWCRSEHKIKITEFRYESLPSKTPEPIVLSLEEALKIILHAETMYKVFFFALYFLGLRFYEATSLRWEDLDRKNATIIIRNAKGNKERRLPVSKWLLKMFNLLKPKSEGLIFRSKISGGMIKNVIPAIDRACKAAGIKKHVYPHLLRHTLATHLMEMNVNIKVIQRILGHSRESTTADMYTHANVDHMRVAQTALEKKMKRIADKILKKR
jgi:integrase